MDHIRTRFAPSPTGYLHVGGLRTALYAYLFAKRHGGTFVLRIEDTDQERLFPKAAEGIIDALSWAGITIDEGPHVGGPYGSYIQSERLDLYKKHALELVQAGHAYYCFCSSERLDRMRELQMAQNKPSSYDRRCRKLTPEEVAQKLAAGEPSVIRMKVPLVGDVTFTDLIRGKINFSYNVIDDQVLLKSDGFPTYHLAVVVDDHYMKISHVIRGEEWLSSTPKHILLYQYFGWEMPQVAHLSLILNPDRSKLSKRQGDVAVEDYRAKGYLPEALVNFVALLGWNPGDEREIFPLAALEKEFSLERVGKSGAIFDIEKLNWMNQQYIIYKPLEELVEIAKPFFAQHGCLGAADVPVSDDYLKHVVTLMKDRAITLPDFCVKASFFFKDPAMYDEQARAKNWKPETAAHLKALSEAFAQLPEFTATNAEQALRATAQTLGVGAGALIHPVRLAVTGVSNGPGLFATLEVLGKEVVIRRMASAINTLG